MSRPEDLRNSANKLFAQQKYAEAEQLYSEALHACEVDHVSKDLHLIYSNR